MILPCFSIRNPRCLAWNNGWIGPREVRSEAESMGKSNYAAYLLDLLAQKGG